MHRETEQRKGTHLLGNHTGVGDHEHMGMWAPWTQDVGVGLTRVVIIEQEGGLLGSTEGVQWGLAPHFGLG